VAVTEPTADELATRGAAAVVLAVVVWGFGPILIKKIGVPGLVLAFWRLWIGFAVVAVALAIRGGRLSWQSVRRSAVGGACFGLNVALFTSAVRRTSVAEVTLVSSFQPVLVLLVAGPLFGERPGRREVLLVLASLGGVAVFEAGAVQGPVWSLTGYLLAVAALVTFTGYYLASKQAREHLGALEYMTAALLVSAVVVTPPALLTGQDLGAVHGRSWLWLALFVLFPGAFGHLLVNWAHRFVDVTISSVIVVGLPVVAALLAFVLLHETLGPLELLGGAIVIVCVAAIAARPTIASRPDDPPVGELPI
jgi:drug/metabolite transporter (DMT)-like permease